MSHTSPGGCQDISVQPRPFQSNQIPAQRGRKLWPSPVFEGRTSYPDNYVGIVRLHSHGGLKRSHRWKLFNEPGQPESV